MTSFLIWDAVASIHGSQNHLNILCAAFSHDKHLVHSNFMEDSIIKIKMCLKEPETISTPLVVFIIKFLAIHKVFFLLTFVSFKNTLSLFDKAIKQCHVIFIKLSHTLLFNNFLMLRTIFIKRTIHIIIRIHMNIQTLKEWVYERDPFIDIPLKLLYYRFLFRNIGYNIGFPIVNILVISSKLAF